MKGWNSVRLNKKREDYPDPEWVRKAQSKWKGANSAELYGSLPVERRATVRRHGGGVVLRPRGPRSCPSYAVSNRHHLIDPIRPTREHIAISPHSGLYAMPSLCGSAEATRGWFRAFADHSFLACRSL